MFAEAVGSLSAFPDFNRDFCGLEWNIGYRYNGLLGFAKRLCVFNRRVNVGYYEARIMEESSRCC